jgi:hypothetical protein
MTTLHGGFRMVSWDENAYDEREGRRLTRASVSQRGRFEAPHGSEASYELEVELPER